MGMKNKTIEKAIHLVGGQINLAAAVGISQTSIHKLLTYKSKEMRFSTALRISEATGISLQEIADSYKSPPPHNDDANITL